MAQNDTKLVTLVSIIRSAAFVKGFSDKLEGKEFNYDYSTNTNTQWNYERGRMLAMVYKGPLKNGKKVLNRAIFALSDAIYDGVAI